MSERIHFSKPEELKEKEIEIRIKERDAEGNPIGGIVFEEERDPETNEIKKYIYIGNPYEERGPIIKLETEATREDIEQIKKEIVPMKETFEILVALAMAYRNRQLLLIEGPTAIGKTYLVERFTEMLYGYGQKPLDFYCSGQTDVSELMAKWVPKVETEEELRKWKNFLELPETQSKISQIAQEVEGKETLISEQKVALVLERIRQLAQEAGLSERTQWQFQYGAIPKAMGLIRNPDGTFSFHEENGRGFILHIQEVGLAEPQVINALLKLRGKKGHVAEVIQLWENGGKQIKAGPKFWVVFSTNPPEEYLARNEVDQALARGVIFMRVGDLSEESLHLASDYYFNYRVGTKPEEKPQVLDIYNHPEIGKEIAKIVASFHNDFNKELKKGEKGRQQRIPLTLDDMARVAEGLITTQIRNKETGYLDLSETLKILIHFYYLARLADQDLKKTMEANLNEILEGTTGKVEFEGKIITRKEMLDILVERASVPEEERENAEQKKREAERFRLKYEAEDKLEFLSLDQEISEPVRKRLRALLERL